MTDLAWVCSCLSWGMRTTTRRPTYTWRCTAGSWTWACDELRPR